MIVLSFLLVVIAAVTLLVGLFQDTLTWIWISIGACVLAMIFLGIGVLQRRSSRREPEGSEGPAYGPGAISSLITGSDESDEQDVTPAVQDEEITVVPKRTVSDARGEISRAEAEEAADQAVADAEAKTSAGSAADEAAETQVLTEEQPPAPAETTRRRTAKKATENARKKKSAKKSGKKSATRSSKKSAKKTTKKTTGKAARERLDQVKGLGPAKQKALLDEFGSLEAIRDADVSDLQEVKGIGEATAREIRKQLS